MTKIFVWGGQHSTEIFKLIERVYHSKNDLLILCPPRIQDITPWISFLPTGTIEFVGELSNLAGLEHESSVKYPEAPKFGLFSTGTENGAKLILYTNKNFETSIAGIFSYFQHLKIKKIFSYPQPYHVFGLGLGYLSCLFLKKELIIPEGAYSREAHESWFKASHTSGANLLTLGTPTHFLDAYEHRQDYPSSLTCIAGGARVEKAFWHLMQDKLHISLPSIGYGCSEASPGMTHLAPGLIPQSDNDLGKVIPGGELRQNGSDFTYVGPNVCLAMIQNGVIQFPQGEYALSDSLITNEKGHYFYVKRNTLVLNRGGEKFPLEEIELMLKKKFQIEVVALAIVDARLGHELGLVYEGKESKGAIVEYLKEIYSRSFSPELMLNLEKLPVNENAKYDRHQCEKALNESR